MQSKKVTLVYFSPTGTTKSIVETIAAGTGLKISQVLDITQKKSRFHADVVISGPVMFAVPVYAGRVQKDAVEFISKLHGDGSPAAIVVVYGNRAYEDALVELSDVVTKAGFLPVAAAAFIAEHSFSNELTPIASGRPDEEDLEHARSFGKSIVEKLVNSSEEFIQIVLPGNRPYKEGVSVPAYEAVAVSQECTMCKTCVDACPMDIISVSDTISYEIKQCIFCSACIKACPTGARSLNNGIIKDIAERLSGTCQKRKAPQMFV